MKSKSILRLTSCSAPIPIIQSVTQSVDDFLGTNVVQEVGGFPLGYDRGPTQNIHMADNRVYDVWYNLFVGEGLRFLVTRLVMSRPH